MGKNGSSFILCELIHQVINLFHFLYMFSKLRGFDVCTMFVTVEQTKGCQVTL